MVGGRLWRDGLFLLSSPADGGHQQDMANIVQGVSKLANRPSKGEQQSLAQDVLGDVDIRS
jgi:hypothetical protein